MSKENLIPDEEKTEFVGDILKSLPPTEAEREFAVQYYRRLAIGSLTVLAGYTALIGAVVAVESAGIRVGPDQINAAVAVATLGGSVPAILAAIIG